MDETSLEDRVRTGLLGDGPEVLEVIWEGYAADLFAYLAGMLGSRHDAEDLLQDVLVRIVEKRQHVAHSRSVRAYLYRMARNEALNFLKRRKRRAERIGDPDFGLAPAEERGPDGDDARRIAEALAGLPDGQRAVVVLKVWRDMTFREVAGALGIGENTAASRYRYAMAKLREWVRRDPE